MEEGAYSVSLNLMQWAQLFSHLQTYLVVFCVLAFPETPEQKARCELLIEVGYRFCQVREKEWDEERDAVAFSLHQEEMQALKAMLTALQPAYEAGHLSQ